MLSQTASVWVVIVVAFAAANLPFLNEKLLGVVPMRAAKSLAVRVGELAGAAGALSAAKRSYTFAVKEAA